MTTYNAKLEDALLPIVRKAIADICRVNALSHQGIAHVGEDTPQIVKVRDHVERIWGKEATEYFDSILIDIGDGHRKIQLLPKPRM